MIRKQSKEEHQNEESFGEKIYDALSEYTDILENNVNLDKMGFAHIDAFETCKDLNKKEDKMINKVKVNWKQNDEQKDVVYFKDLGYEAFRIKGCSAVYLKVHFDDKYRNSNKHYPLSEYPDLMLEVATGNMFIPTKSAVERVDTTISVDLAKPTIYN